MPISKKEAAACLAAGIKNCSGCPFDQRQACLQISDQQTGTSDVNYGELSVRIRKEMEEINRGDRKTHLGSEG